MGRYVTVLCYWHFLRLTIGRDTGATQQTDSIEQDPRLVTHATAIDTAFPLVDWWNQDAKKIDQVARATAHQVHSLF
jgi:hypothetical protein